METSHLSMYSSMSLYQTYCYLYFIANIIYSWCAVSFPNIWKSFDVIKPEIRVKPYREKNTTNSDNVRCPMCMLCIHYDDIMMTRCGWRYVQNDPKLLDYIHNVSGFGFGHQTRYHIMLSWEQKMVHGYYRQHMVTKTRGLSAWQLRCLNCLCYTNDV